MKDIYIIMGQQNILTFYSRKLDIRIDNSENFDYQDNREEIYDLKIDYSEYYDFELDYTPDYELELPDVQSLHRLTLSVNFETDDYYLCDINGNILMTQGYNNLQFQF